MRTIKDIDKKTVEYQRLLQIELLNEVLKELKGLRRDIKKLDK